MIASELNQALADLDTLHGSLNCAPKTLEEIQLANKTLIAIFGTEQRIHSALADLNASSVAKCDQLAAAIGHFMSQLTNPDHGPGFDL